MRRHFFDYDAFSEAIHIFGGIFLLFYCIELARKTCDALGIDGFGPILLFYFLWMAFFIILANTIDGKLRPYFDKKNMEYEERYFDFMEWQRVKKEKHQIDITKKKGTSKSIDNILAEWEESKRNK